MLAWTSRTLARISSARGGPDEWFCVAVPVGDVVLDPLDENLDRTERAAANRLAGDDAEPGFVG
jgi:hypothetical protein